MKCMHEDHDGSASKLIFVPEKRAKGHEKIKGPLICDICYHKEFNKTDWLPEDVWIQPEGQRSPSQLVKELPSAFPHKTMDVLASILTFGLVNLSGDDSQSKGR